MTFSWQIAPDGDNEPTLWRHRSWDDPQPEAVAQRCDTHPVLWALAELLVAYGPTGATVRAAVDAALAGREVSP